MDQPPIQGSRIRLVLGCVISPLRQHTESRNLGQTLFGSPVFISREAAVLVFNQKDRDQNGKMSFEEFSGQKTRSELAFEAIDKNGDGYVSRKAEYEMTTKKLLNVQALSVTVTPVRVTIRLQ